MKDDNHNHNTQNIAIGILFILVVGLWIDLPKIEWSTEISVIIISGFIILLGYFGIIREGN